MKNNKRRQMAFILTLAMTFSCLWSGGAVCAESTQETSGAETASTVTQPSAELIDISDHWGKSDIENAVKLGFVTGYEDETFKPDKAVTRAEFVTMINKALQLRAENTVNLLFRDVKETTWYYKEIQKASYAKYVSGVSDTSFVPNKNITREEAAVMLTGFLPKDGYEEENSLNSYTDKEQISNWAKDAMVVVINKGYLTGYKNGNLAPKATLTRAEAAKVIGEILGKEMIIREDTSVINTGEVLKDKIYVGDITIENTVGEGDAALENLSALSSVYVEGGGINTVSISNSTVIRLIVSKEGTTVRVLSGDSKIYEAYIFNGNLLVNNQGLDAQTGENGYESIVYIDGIVSVDEAIKIVAEIARIIDNSGKITQEQVSEGVAAILTGSTAIVNPDGSITVSVKDTPATSGGSSHHHSSDSSPMQLTIGTPLLELSKYYDGTTMAAITTGALSGVASGDSVTVSAIAYYDSEVIGFDKTITVVYTIGGVNADKYLVPANYTVNTGTILNAGDYAVTIKESNDLSGAVIDIYDEFYFGNLLSTVTTDSSGQAKIALPNGSYYYKVNKSGFGIEQGMFRVLGSAVTENFNMIASMPEIFKENFDGVSNGSIPSGWSLVDSDDWFVDSYADAGGTAPELCYVTCYETGTFNAISCPIDLTSASGNLNLSLKHYLSLMSPAPTSDPGVVIAIKITKDNGTNWETLFTDDPTLAEYPEDYAYGPFTENVDISSYAGQTVKLAFVVAGDTNYIQYWSIDDIVISGE